MTSLIPQARPVSVPAGDTSSSTQRLLTPIETHIE
jgi:hypothetical protein